MKADSNQKKKKNMIGTENAENVSETGTHTDGSPEENNKKNNKDMKNKTDEKNEKNKGGSGKKQKKYTPFDYFKGFGTVMKYIGKGMLKIGGVFVNILLTMLLILAITGVIVGCTFAVYLGNFVETDISEFELMSNDQSQTTTIYCYGSDGSIIEVSGGRLYASENRVWVPYEDIPKDLVNAFIAIEDKRFEDHNGVDWKRTIRAFAYYAIGRSDSGGSTITQQLYKNVMQKDDYTIQRKVEEIFSALALEKQMSKEQILEMYLNTVYFSERSYGVQAAARTYFGKDVSDLELNECAALASIVQNPYKWDPYLHPENNYERRNNILWEMLDQGKITQLEYDEAHGKDLDIVIGKDEDDDDDENEDNVDTSNVTSWYIDAVIDDAKKIFMDLYGVTDVAASRMVYSGGFKIYIAMDPDVQSAMEEVFEDDELINKLVNASDGLMQPQSAMVVIHPTNGNILGIVGGRGVKTQSRILNYATQTTRQPGSSIKPVATYGPALQKGIINYSTVLDDSPFLFNESTGAGGKTVYSAWPSNSPARYAGLTPLNDGITRSVNTVAVRVLNSLGERNSFIFLTEKLGITSLIDQKVINGKVSTDIGLAQLGLGGLTYGVSVKEMTAAYTIFTNDGVYISPRTILEIRDSEDKVVYNDQPTENVALSIENAAIMRQMLWNVTHKSTGTGYGMEITKYVDTAGKTGTTNKNYDKWFIGFTPYYLGGVWFGYENQQTISGFTTYPGVKIWDAVMMRIHEKIINDAKENGTQLKKFEMPDTVVKLEYCRDSGLIATDACKLDPRGSRIETGYYTIDNMPQSFCTTHKTVKYCTEGKGIASEYCPDDVCVDIALIKVTTRDFPTQVSITDAQYVYRDLTIGKVVYSKADGAYFLNEIADGHYCGKTSSTSTPYNHYCQKHYSGQPYGLVIQDDNLSQSRSMTLPPDIDKMLGINDETRLYKTEE